MALTVGTHLGRYEVLGSIGAGGMGEVYRARDTRLGRLVAIKVLPSEFGEERDRLLRFEQEAKAAAALNHPNVMSVFDVGLEGQVPYVVSELLEGETLSKAVSRGSLPLQHAMSLASQLASGMAAAHQKGIVHRDLKPSNIFVTDDGRVKILDFGLAKMPARPATADLADPSATPATTPGAVLGTAGYMSPEQLRGQPADHRSDIFAFGAVFYEMLSGQRAFLHGTAVDVLTAILSKDPPPLPTDRIPLPLCRLVQRCLEKKPADRFQSALDIAFALDALAEPYSTTAPITVPPSRRSRWLSVLAIGLAVGVALGVAGAWRWAPGPSGTVEFEARTFDRLPVTNARFMPDGQTIVYSAAPHAYTPELFVIGPSSEAPQSLGVPNAHLLSISSKGELALIVDARHLAQRLYTGTLARMTLGSSPRAMARNAREADWAPEGEAMAVVLDLGGGRDRLEYPSGTVLHEASGYLSDPRVSPDGSRVAFFEHQWRFDDRGWVKVVDRTGTVTTLTSELWGLQGLAWSSDGSHVVFSGNDTGGRVMQPMSVGASGGEAARPVFGVPGRFIVHDIAASGRWLAVREDLSLGVRAQVPGQSAEQDLSWLGSTGARALSSDGSWLLMVDVGVRGGRDYGVVLRRTDASQTIRLGRGNPQSLSPDGRWAAAIVAMPPSVVVYPTGPGEAIRIEGGPIERFISVDWFPDGSALVVCGSEAGRAPRCYEQDLAGSPPSPITADGVLASLAPDGRTLLLALQDGTFRRASLEGDTSQPVAALVEGDRPISWSRDSTAVYVQSGSGVPARVERVDLTTGSRAVVRELAPEGPGPIVMLKVEDWIEDGRWLVYNYTTLPSTLFVVEGAGI